MNKFNNKFNNRYIQSYLQKNNKFKNEVNNKFSNEYLSDLNLYINIQNNAKRISKDFIIASLLYSLLYSPFFYYIAKNILKNKKPQLPSKILIITAILIEIFTVYIKVLLCKNKTDRNNTLLKNHHAGLIKNYQCWYDNFDQKYISLLFYGILIPLIYGIY